MKVAVSGASGFVGSALCRSLAEQGCSVFRLSRTAEQDDLDQGIIAWHPQNGLQTPESLSGFEGVVHLAGKSVGAGRWTKKLKREIRDSRVPATRKLAEQLASLPDPPRCVVSASAVGIYGTGTTAETRDVIHTESGALEASDFLAEVALEWEEACSPLRDAGVRVAHPRLGIVLGKAGGALGKVLPLFRWGLGGKLGAGEQFWSWIAIEDCVRAIEWLLNENAAEGPYNLVAPNPVRNSEFTSALARQLRRPSCLPAPAFMLRLVLGEMADAMLLGSCRVVPERLLQQGFSFQHSDLPAFLADELGPAAN